MLKLTLMDCRRASDLEECDDLTHTTECYGKVYSWEGTYFPISNDSSGNYSYVAWHESLTPELAATINDDEKRLRNHLSKI